MQTTKPTGLAILAAIAIVTLLVTIGGVKACQAIAASGAQGLTVTGPAPNGVSYDKPVRFGNHKQSCADPAKWSGNRQLLPCVSLDRPAANGNTWIFLQTRNPFRAGGYGWTCHVPPPLTLGIGYAELQCFQITFPG